MLSGPTSISSLLRDHVIITDITCLAWNVRYPRNSSVPPKESSMPPWRSLSGLTPRAPLPGFPISPLGRPSRAPRSHLSGAPPRLPDLTPRAPLPGSPISPLGVPLGLPGLTSRVPSRAPRSHPMGAPPGLLDLTPPAPLPGCPVSREAHPGSVCVSCSGRNAPEARPWPFIDYWEPRTRRGGVRRVGEGARRETRVTEGKHTHSDSEGGGKSSVREGGRDWWLEDVRGGV